MDSAYSRNDLHLLGIFGSNKVMAGELSRLVRRAFDKDRANEVLGAGPTKVGPGGLVLPFSADLAAICVNYHRTSARVLWDLAQSPATRLSRLYEDLVQGLSASADLMWPQETRFSVLAFGTQSVQAGERQVVGVVKNALIEVARQRGVVLELDPEKPDLLFHARSFPRADGSSHLVVSLDLAGRPMHQRGYRTQAGPAPLREDLAAVLVMLSRFDPRQEVFIDPLAGSGTLAVEAALMASGRPLWMSGRQPSAVLLEPLKAALREHHGPLFGDCAPRIFAAELDPESHRLMERAIETAGTQRTISVHLGDFRDWDLRRTLGREERGLILCNPPYGARLSGSRAELRTLYRDLGTWCREFPGFRAGFIIGEPQAEAGKKAAGSVSRLFQESFGGAPRVKKPLSNGPLRAQFLLYDL